MTRPDAHGARAVERRTVSRKTPGDGKLEITKVAAGRLESLGEHFDVVLAGHTARARLGSMPCTCRGGDTPHVHYFVESDLLRTLTSGDEVELLVDDAGKRLLIVSG